jgi:hypothetical protein
MVTIDGALRILSINHSFRMVFDLVHQLQDTQFT